MNPVKLNIHYSSINNVVEKTDFVEEFRSPQSDIEIPKTRKRERGVSGIDEGLTDTLAKGAIEVTKDNMSTSNRPSGNKIGYLYIY